MQSAVFYQNMILIALYFIIFLIHPNPNLADDLHRVLAPLQDFCYSQIPPSHYLELNQAIVCGLNPAPSQDLQLMRWGGLIHILVVSGSHLVFLEEILRKVTKRKWPIILLLILYTGMTGFQAPVVRALMSYLTKLVSNYKRLNFTSLQTTLLGGFLCLAMFPNWLTSYSFLLSWGAAVAIQLTRKSILLHQSMIYLFLFPLFSLFSPPHPISILLNISLAPLIGSVIFPLCLLLLILPFFLSSLLSSLTDYLWQLTLQITAYCQSEIDSPYASPLSDSHHATIFYMWIYVWGTHLILLFWWTYKRRRV